MKISEFNVKTDKYYVRLTFMLLIVSISTIWYMVEYYDFIGKFIILGIVFVIFTVIGIPVTISSSGDVKGGERKNVTKHLYQKYKDIINKDDGIPNHIDEGIGESERRVILELMKMVADRKEQNQNKPVDKPEQTN